LIVFAFPMPEFSSYHRRCRVAEIETMRLASYGNDPFVCLLARVWRLRWNTARATLCPSRANDDNPADYRLSRLLLLK